MKILYFKQFCEHFVFVDDGGCRKKKLLKNYANVNVHIDRVCGDTKIDFERCIKRRGRAKLSEETLIIRV